jgi:hypothetical protein
MDNDVEKMEVYGENDVFLFEDYFRDIKNEIEFFQK